MIWYLGTMGFSYTDWKGVFYPSQMPLRNYLTYYSRIFNCVEIDSTFYGIPRTETVERWNYSTPTYFKFCIKAPRLITHELMLLNVEAALDEFLDSLSGLKDKLGVVLFQFPASFTSAGFDRLRKLVYALPLSIRFAIEVRDISWHLQSDELVRVCKDHNICWTATEYPNLPEVIYRTADFGYIRWIGKHGKYPIHDREYVDLTRKMQIWYKKILNHQSGFRDTFGFFNNDYAGFAAGSTNRFKTILGLPNIDFTPPQQVSLF